MLMKRILSLLTIVLCSVTIMYSQVTITKASHGFTNDDRHETAAVDYQEPGPGGQNLVWDYSQLVLPETAATDYQSYMQDNRNESNIAAKRSDDVTFFFDITEKGNDYIGYETENQKLILSQPMVKTLYPQSFGKYFEGSFTGEIVNKTSGNTTPVSGINSTHADATGTLILPDGNTFEALRVHTTERMEYQNYAYVTEKYLWYAQSVKYPLFVTMKSYTETSDGKVYQGSSKSFVSVGYTQAPQAPTAIKAIAGDVTCRITPNPFSNAIEMSYYLPEATKVTIELFNAAGAKVSTLLSNETQSGQVNLSRNLAEITNKTEVYILKLTFGNEVQTVKLIRNAK